MYKHVSCWNGFILHIERVQWLLVHARTGPRLTHWTIHTYAYMTLTSSMVTMMYKAIHTSSYTADSRGRYRGVYAYKDGCTDPPNRVGLKL